MNGLCTCISNKFKPMEIQNIACTCMYVVFLLLQNEHNMCLKQYLYFVIYLLLQNPFVEHHKLPCFDRVSLWEGRGVFIASYNVFVTHCKLRYWIFHSLHVFCTQRPSISIEQSFYYFPSVKTAIILMKNQSCMQCSFQ